MFVARTIFCYVCRMPLAFARRMFPGAPALLADGLLRSSCRAHSVACGSMVLSRPQTGRPASQICGAVIRPRFHPSHAGDRPC